MHLQCLSNINYRSHAIVKESKILIGVSDCYLPSGGHFFSYIIVKIADNLMIIMLMMFLY